MNKYIHIVLYIVLLSSCTLKNNKVNTEQSVGMEIQIQELIKILIEDSKLHEKIGPKLTNTEIQKIENDLGLKLPPSYKFFLKEFGNGAYWLYANPIDDIKQKSFLSTYREGLGEIIELIGEKELKVNTLLSLMSEDSNGGAWVWLTSENSENGEWSLAYYSMDDKKLHYKVKNFAEWLRLLIKNKSEVIRALDIENKLGLG
ncbi:SMI1/KNR4 family protein [Tenacibaculum aiptasiae]|nr:SMI1/KNR4 family protein [Tenacibaculum aiptasiae]